PQPEADGTWSWSGPEGFATATREVAISNIQPAQAGIYKVTYTNADGCQSSIQTFTLDVTPEIVTGVYNEAPLRFLLYPNPTTSMVTISNAGEWRSVTLRDIYGRTISGVRIDGDRAEVSLKDLPKAIYLIELVDHHNRITIRKVVKE